MNHIHRSIWNDQAGTFVAVSESTRGAGKKASSGTARGQTRLKLKLLSVSLMMACGVSVQAQPMGGVVSAGAATIGGTSGKMAITQTTPNVAINWQSFGIKAGESVRFIQPDSSSVALNRVIGADPSNILGSLTANGKVFLVNPNGILFGQGASVNVGGLVASTLAISDADFMTRNYQFSGAGKGVVSNDGSINAADGGYVALLGANVSNQGTIAARLGTVALAAGNAVTLDVAGDKLLNVTVTQGALNALVDNGGLIRADGGQVLMTTQAAGSLLANAVNNTGLVQAQTLQNNNGTIKLLGGMQSGVVSAGGTLDASGAGTGQTGGSVTLTGYHVGLFGGQINASGDAGGGTVLVGGGYQGNNAAVQNASATYLSADSTINVDALTNGKGGTAVVWANDSTRAYGVVTARGGAQGGNGGLIETSAHWLDVEGIRVNASALSGKAGMWLLDPTDVTISTGSQSNEIRTGNVFSPTAGAQTSNINSNTLSAALSGINGTDVTITTTSTGNAAGNITVQDPVTLIRTGFTPTTLTLHAAGDVNINAAIKATDGNLVVCCGRNITVGPPLVDPQITITRGSLLFSAGQNININGAMTMTNANALFCSGTDININAAMTMTNGSTPGANNLGNPGVNFVPQGLTLRAGNAATGPGLTGGGGAVNIAPPGGTITITQGGSTTTAAPVSVTYNPNSYTAPVTNFSGFFDAGTPLTQLMLVFPEVQPKPSDNTFAATFTGLLRGDAAGVRPSNVTLNTAGGVANFDSLAVGTNVPVTFSGVNLNQTITTGGTARNFALAAPCCGPDNIATVTRTAGTRQPALLAALSAGPPAVGASVASTPAGVALVASPFVFPSVVSPRAAVPPLVPGDVALLIVPPAATPPSVLTVAPPPAPPVTPVAVLPETPEVAPQPYVAPIRVRKQDRH